MQLITTHINADFDGFASMVAAQKLYPEAVMTFPGSLGKNVRDFMAQHLQETYHFEKSRNIPFAEVTRLIIVDTRAADRIGTLAQCLANRDIDVIIFDHHPASPGDIGEAEEHIRPVGATATIITGVLKKEGISLTAEEATLFCLGIYEDTGSLCHLTTTPEDLQMAAWLLEQGARLDIVRQYTANELTSGQVELLHSLIQASKRFVIQDVPLVVITITLDTFVDDFAVLAGRLMTMENLDALFLLVCMAGRIYLIARSRIPEVNAGAIARDLGGGGHAAAASAAVQNMTLIEAEEKLHRVLRSHISPHPVAREMMSGPPLTVPLATTVEEAHELLTRYNITALPVVRNEIRGTSAAQPVAGIISRHEVEKAIHHSFGERPVSEFMTSDIETLPLSAAIADVQRIIIEQRQRLIPIVEGGVFVGVITRTDLLNRILNDPANFPGTLPEPRKMPQRSKNISRLLNECLEKRLIALLQKIGAIADQFPCRAYIVGGFVRDLLLRKENLDLDIVVEGDGIGFAHRLSEKLGGRVRTHERFATATVVLQDDFKIDIATARLEYYEYPAALPTIELSSIKMDLYRRDFTINAMAIQLNHETFGTLLDFFNSQGDLKAGSLKVLHNLSFVEDPTRIFRAVRLEKRMDFTIARHTERLIRNAVKMNLFDKSGDPRFFNEVRIILSEENPIPAIFRLQDLGLFPFLWPDLKPYLRIDRRFKHILAQAHSAISWFRLLYLKEPFEQWIVYLLTIMSRSGTKEVSAFCRRFCITPAITNELQQQKEHTDKTCKLLQHRSFLRNSEIYWLFEGLSTESLLTLMATARKNIVKQYVSSYVTTLRDVRTATDGKKLKAMGYSPGPAFTTILNDLLSAKLDGRVGDEEDEKRFLHQNYPISTF